MRDHLRQHYPSPAPTPHGSPAHVLDGPPRSAVARNTTQATLNIVLLVSLSRALSHTLISSLSLSLPHIPYGLPAKLWFPTLPPYFFWVRPEPTTFGRQTPKKQKDFVMARFTHISWIPLGTANDTRKTQHSPTQNWTTTRP